MSRPGIWLRQGSSATASIVMAFLTAISCSSAPSGTANTKSSTPSASTGVTGDGARPTVVLVHGAWADASSWAGEVKSLQASGYPVRAIANPLQSLTTDSETVAEFLKTLSGPIVLVGHSYGGSVITNAAAANPSVKALVYVDAAAPDVGETNGSLSGADSVLKHKSEPELFDQLPYPGAPAGVMDLYLKEDIFVTNFANDLPKHRPATLGLAAGRLHGAQEKLWSFY